METVTMLELLNADEEEVRSTLLANDSLDKSREACVETLEDELTSLLLRHNAACSADRDRQAAADCLTATARDALGLLKAGRAEKREAARRIAGGAILLLLGALILCATAVLLATSKPAISYACVVISVLFAYLAGRVWYEGREVSVRAAVDPEEAWYVFRRTVETMDRKLEELSEQRRAAEAGRVPDGGEELDPEELKLFGDLLESLYAKNGEFALRQLARIPDYLEERGVGLVEYGPDTRELFERFPTKRETATQRPALMRGDRLLLMGKATERME